MALRTTIGTARLLVALLGVVALVARFLYGQTFRSFVSVDFFGYLTVQSNIAAVAVFALSGVAVLRRGSEGRRLSHARAAVTCFLIVAGVVFALMVAQAPALGYRIDVPWSDQILHFVLPGIAIIDWLVSPGRTRVSWRLLALAVGYPTVWGIVTLVRGSVVGWYPYFFLDPAQADYPTPFILFSTAALALFAAVQAGIVAASRVAPLAEPDYPGSGSRRAALSAGATRRKVVRARGRAAKRESRTVRD